MFCRYCGAKLPDTAAFCTKCGKKTLQQAAPPAEQAEGLQAPPEAPEEPVPQRPVPQPPVAPEQPVPQRPVPQPPVAPEQPVPPPPAPQPPVAPEEPVPQRPAPQRPLPPPPAPQRPVAPPPAPQRRPVPPEPPKKKGNAGLTVILIVIILALIGILGVIAWFLFAPEEKDDSKRDSSYSGTLPERDPSEENDPTETEPSADVSTEPSRETEPTTEPTTEPEPSETEPTGETSEFGPYEHGGEYLIEGSDSRYVTAADIAGMDYRDIQMAINEIYARRGRIFTTPEIRDYFTSKSWYRGTIAPENFTDDMLNAYEKSNIAFLLEERDKLEQP